MTDQICDRCHKQERIPTHQAIKFDTQVQYLCTECNEKYNTFMNELKKTSGGARAGKPGNLSYNIQGECGRCGQPDYIPEHQKVKDISTSTEHYLCGDDWEQFRTWYHKERYTQGSKQTTPQNIATQVNNILNQQNMLPPTTKRRFP